MLPKISRLWPEAFPSAPHTHRHFLLMACYLRQLAMGQINIGYLRKPLLVLAATAMENPRGFLEKCSQNLWSPLGETPFLTHGTHRPLVPPPGTNSGIFGRVCGIDAIDWPLPSSPGSRQAADQGCLLLVSLLSGRFLFLVFNGFLMIFTWCLLGFYLT